MKIENAVASTWNYFCALPNLSTGLRFAFESPLIAIVPPNDPRLQTIIANPAAIATASIHNNFSTYDGREFKPCALLFSSALHPNKRTAEAFRSFRNAAAFATLSHCRAHAVSSDGQWQPLYSDFFDFFPRVPSADERHVGSLSGPVNSFGEPKQWDFQPSPWIGNPMSFSVSRDNRLWDLLLRSWERRFYSGRSSPTLRHAFRSLDVAYHAARIPTDGLPCIGDAGIRIGLWVSAIEILCHPGSGRVTLEMIIEELGKISWRDALLNRRSYSIRIGHSKRRVKFLQRLYKRLYDARNAFFHGNQVSPATPYFKKKRLSGDLEINGILIYSALLRERLQRVIRHRSRHAFQFDFDRRDLEAALLAVARQRNRFEEP